LCVWRPIPMASLGLVAGLSLLLAYQPADGGGASLDATLVPPTLRLPTGVAYVASAQEIRMSDKELEILENPTYLARYYQGSDGQGFQLMVIFSANNRKAVHPPQVCLSGSGYRILEEHDRYVALPDGRQIKIRELLAQKDAGLDLFLYVYKCGDSYTPSFFMQQLRVALGVALGKITGQSPAGALIRLTVPVRGQDADAGRKQAQRIAEEIMPRIDEGLRREAARGKP
jgi:EpsI family protein